MPIVNADGCAIYVEVDGPERAPALMLSNSLGTTLHMWDAQVAPFTRYIRLVRYDRRGHGRSGVPKGPYTMDRLGRDVLAVLDALGIERVNWCGLSMGGMVGQWLGANAPERIERLVLTNTSSYFADKTMWNERLKLVREKGVAAFAAANMERWFTKGFRERSPKVVAWMQERTAVRVPLHPNKAEKAQLNWILRRCGRCCGISRHKRRRRRRNPPPSARRVHGLPPKSHPRCGRTIDKGFLRRAAHQGSHPGRPLRHARCRAYFERRAGGGIHERGRGIFAGVIISSDTPPQEGESTASGIMGRVRPDQPDCQTTLPSPPGTRAAWSRSACERSGRSGTDRRKQDRRRSHGSADW